MCWSLKKENRLMVYSFVYSGTTLAYSRSALDGKLVSRPLMKPHASITKSKFSTKESINIIIALGETRSPQAIGPLTGTMRRIQERDFLIAVLQAFAKIRSPNAVMPTAEILKIPDPHIRILALDTLGHIKSPKSQQVILPALYDSDARIRWKAVYALGKLGYPDAAGHISFLLGDTDEAVRTISEITLKKLGHTRRKNCPLEG